MNYTERKKFFDQLLTVYGRKPVLEALLDDALPAYRLHLATSNRSDGTLKQILKLAELRGIDVQRHNRDELSRISRNRRQDQGVALDLQCPNYSDDSSLLRQRNFRLIALDRVTNPQNLGMVIRSVCASPLDGLLLPVSGCAPLSPLVIKASAGTLFRCPIFRCKNLAESLQQLRAKGCEVCVLDAGATQQLNKHQPAEKVIYVLGNESEGVSASIAQLAATRLSIPMARGVESLNIAVTAALLAFARLDGSEG